MNTLNETKVVSLVIPVYNNAQSLPILIERILGVVRSQNSIVFEVLLIDDGSIDESWLVIKREKEKHPDTIRGIRLSRNFGQLAAMIAGWEASRGDAVINLSADLQDPPELIPTLVKSWQQGKDLVIGIRTNRNDGAIAKVTSAVAHRIIRNSYPDMPETWFDYTLMSRRVLQVVTSMKGRFRFSQGDMLYAGFQREFVPYTRDTRPFGRSGYNFWGRLKSFTDSILDSSYILIQFFIRLGVLFSVAAVAYATWIFVARSLGWVSETGWAPIMILILVSSGVIMMMLGIIAEYLWRIYDSIRNKPTHVIDQVI